MGINWGKSDKMEVIMPGCRNCPIWYYRNVWVNPGIWKEIKLSIILRGEICLCSINYHPSHDKVENGWTDDRTTDGKQVSRWMDAVNRDINICEEIRLKAEAEWKWKTYWEMVTREIDLKKKQCYITLSAGAAPKDYSMLQPLQLCHVYQLRLFTEWVPKLLVIISLSHIQI